MTVTEHQSKAIESNSNRILCVSGPGSGKSSTIINRIARLVGAGTPSQNICAISFTNAASRILEQRLAKVNIAVGFCGTIHSLMLRIIRQDPDAIGFYQGVTVIDEEQTAALLEEVCEDMSWKGTMSQIEDEIAKGPQTPVKGQSMNKVEVLASAFHQRLKENNLITYDGVLWHGLKALSTENCHNYVAHSFTHLMVDELQDSSPIDHDIYRSLPIDNKFWVGDSDQAIYSFRGGSVEQMLALSCCSGMETIQLQENFRCKSGICHAAQSLIEHNHQRVAKATIAVNEGGTIGCIPSETAGEERAWVVKMIRELTDTPPEEKAVLVRTNYLAQQFSAALIEAGIPVRKKKVVELPDDWSKAKLYLSMLNDPENDRLAFLAIKASKGQAKAEDVRRAALKAFTTINDIGLHLDPIDNLDAGLAKLGTMGLGRESMFKVREIAETLTNEASLADLLLAMGHEPEPEEGDGVFVGTQHSGKGREWKVCILPAFEEEIMNKKGSDEEENRRVAFVAVTRAKDAVFISYAKTRKPQWGEAYQTTPCKFIREMGLT